MIDAKSPRDVDVVGSKQTGRSAVTVAIYGAGGFAREVLQLIKDIAATGTPIACAGFLEDAIFHRSDLLNGLPVYADPGRFGDDEKLAFIVAIGSPVARARIVRAGERAFGTRFVTLVHPRATLGDTVSVASGVIACPGSVAMADISIGAHAQLHVNCTIGHGTIVREFATVAPGANVGGWVEIGQGAFVGSGAVILPHVKIGEWSIIGAGAVVTKDVPDDSTVAGLPAKVTAQRAHGWQLGSDHRELELLYTGRCH